MLIYKATNKITNKSYIGQTIKKLDQRKSEHKRRAFFENSNTKFYNAIKKYGWDNFTWEILEESNEWSKEELDEKEIYYIQLYDTINNGYNILIGGGCSESDGLTMSIACGSKPFYAFNIKGEFLGEFINKSEFEREYGIIVQRTCEMIKNKTLSAKNIIVIDKELYTPELLRYRLDNCVKKYTFLAIEKSSGIIKGEFDSIEECKRILNLPKNCHIGEVLKQQRKSSNGYVFKYKE